MVVHFLVMRLFSWLVRADDKHHRKPRLPITTCVNSPVALRSGAFGLPVFSKSVDVIPVGAALVGIAGLKCDNLTASQAQNIIAISLLAKRVGGVPLTYHTSEWAAVEALGKRQVEKVPNPAVETTLPTHGRTLWKNPTLWNAAATAFLCAHSGWDDSPAVTGGSDSSLVAPSSAKALLPLANCLAHLSRNAGHPVIVIKSLFSPASHDTLAIVSSLRSRIWSVARSRPKSPRRPTDVVKAKSPAVDRGVIHDVLNGDGELEGRVLSFIGHLDVPLIPLPAWSACCCLSHPKSELGGVEKLLGMKRIFNTSPASLPDDTRALISAAAELSRRGLIGASVWTRALAGNEGMSNPLAAVVAEAICKYYKFVLTPMPDKPVEVTIPSFSTHHAALSSSFHAMSSDS